jgi:hypothetical protein
MRWTTITLNQQSTISWHIENHFSHHRKDVESCSFQGACRDSTAAVYTIVTTIALTDLVWYYVRAWKSESILKKKVFE